jgi:hypothetical protein
MTNFYTKNDWDTVFCWAVDSLCDDKEVLLDLIGDENAFTRLYYESYQDCGSGVDKSTDVWHCGNYGKVMAMTSGRAGCAFDLIERLINHFADGGLDLLRLGDSDYVFKFYTDKLVEAVYEDLTDNNNAGLKALIDDSDDEESSELYKVTTYDGGDKYNHIYFNNLQEATSHYHVTSGWHVSLTTGELDSPIIMEKDEDED